MLARWLPESFEDGTLDEPGPRDESLTFSLPEASHGIGSRAHFTGSPGEPG